MSLPHQSALPLPYPYKVRNHQMIPFNGSHWWSFLKHCKKFSIFVLGKVLKVWIKKAFRKWIKDPYISHILFLVLCRFMVWKVVKFAEATLEVYLLMNSVNKVEINAELVIALIPNFITLSSSTTFLSGRNKKIKNYKPIIIDISSW